MSDRLERNFKMAHAASPNVSLPPSKAYRDNWDSIFSRRSKTKKQKPECIAQTTKRAKTKCVSASSPSSHTTWKSQSDTTAKDRTNTSDTTTSSKTSASTKKRKISTKQLSKLGLAMYGIR